MLVLRKDLGRTQVAALRYSLCLFLRTKGSKTYRTTGDLPLTHRIEKQLGKMITSFFLSLFAPARERKRERESYEGLRVVTG